MVDQPQPQTPPHAPGTHPAPHTRKPRRTTLLKAATYNLLDGGQRRPDKGLPERLPAQLAMLRALDLDILCLQEGKNWHRDKHRTLYAVARALGMQPLFAPSASHGCHLAIFYRWPRVRCLAFEPDIACGTFHHTAAYAELAIEGCAQPIDVINTHLSPLNPAVRRDEAGWLTEYAKRGRYTLLHGDLNAGQPVATTPDRLTNCIPADEHSRHLVQGPGGVYTDEVDLRALHALLGADFIDPPAALGLPTPRTAGYWRGGKGGERPGLWDHRSDYILLSPSLAPALRNSEVIDTPAARLLSDHLPVTVTLDLTQL
ncbi:endonuclease/exonuclease/phosphatase family protein [Streptomyces sp. NPDC050610]|uniref:endonuclease/exonuclease/phosphatase family protein n=1 Tax=Streptomyces sp. NPDC050610 TaxID=3157097 RepID=UPI003443BC17